MQRSFVGVVKRIGDTAVASGACEPDSLVLQLVFHLRHVLIDDCRKVASFTHGYASAVATIVMANEVPATPRGTSA